MPIEAKVIADSTYLGGPRLTTFSLRYPRFIHAELMTHRVFSRNAGSTRATPVAKMLQRVKEDPAMPVHWGRNQAGMQADEELSSVAPGQWRRPGDPVSMEENRLSPKLEAQVEWLRARDSAVAHVERLLALGLHKQVANRLLEPWTHIDVVVTSTDWANWYALRVHPAAQPEIKALAAAMIQAHRASTPRVLRPGEWHLPFITAADITTRYALSGATYNNPPLLQMAKDTELLQKISAARCARVSYGRHDGAPATFEEDLALFARLMGGTPKHASPTEHQARVPQSEDRLPDGRLPEALRSNLYGWIQYRKLIEGENTSRYEEFER